MTKAPRVGLAQNVVSENFKLDGRRSAKLTQELRYQRPALTAQRTREKSKRLLIAARLECIELRLQIRDRFFPREFLELIGAALACSLLRMSDAVRMVRELDGSLSANAKSALTDRMSGIAF